MATELNVTQNLSKMTLDLPADTVTVQVVVKTLKGQYGVCQKTITIGKLLLIHGVRTSSQQNLL